MRCFYVYVHGRLSWAELLNDRDSEAVRPAGFYAHRYVLASSADDAASIAFQRIKANLDDSTGWLKSGRASVHLGADEISPAPLFKLLKPDNRGHVFYEHD